jgi:hypothetical protein
MCQKREIDPKRTQPDGPESPQARRIAANIAKPPEIVREKR